MVKPAPQQHVCLIAGRRLGLRRLRDAGAPACEKTGAQMPRPTTNSYFPPPRHELLNRPKAGDRALGEAMQKDPRRFAKGSVAVKVDEFVRRVQKRRAVSLGAPPQ